MNKGNFYNTGIVIAFVIVVLVGIKILFPNEVSFSFAKPASHVSYIQEGFKPGEVKSDINYCHQQKLDLYEPRIRLYEKTPLLIFIHGGGWRTNSKTSDSGIRMLVDGLRSQGFAIASVGYRLAPAATFPSPQQDVFCAVRYLRANSIKYSLDPDKIAVMGFSAGGNYASLIGVHNGDGLMNNGSYRNTSSRVNAVVSVAGVYDFTRNLLKNSSNNINALMQNTSLALGSPIQYVSNGDSPFLLLRGDKDTVGLAAQDKNFIQALKNANVPVEYVTIKNADHNLNESGGLLEPSREEVSDIIQNFILKEVGLDSIAN